MTPSKSPDHPICVRDLTDLSGDHESVEEEDFDPSSQKGAVGPARSVSFAFQGPHLLMSMFRGRPREGKLQQGWGSVRAQGRKRIVSVLTSLTYDWVKPAEEEAPPSADIIQAMDDIEADPGEPGLALLVFVMER